MAASVGLAFGLTHLLTRENARSWLRRTWAGRSVIKCKNVAEHFMLQRPALHDFVDKHPTMAAICASCAVWIVVIAVFHLVFTVANRLGVTLGPAGVGRHGYGPEDEALRRQVEAQTAEAEAVNGAAAGAPSTAGDAETVHAREGPRRRR